MKEVTDRNPFVNSYELGIRIAFLVDEMRKARALERLTMLRRQEKEGVAFRTKMVEEEEARKRVEEGVACRLEQELEKRSEEIEGEVERRVAAAKLEMEVGWLGKQHLLNWLNYPGMQAAMLKEVENMRFRHLQEEIDKEVLFCKYTTCCGTHNVCKILPNFMKQATLAGKIIHALMLVLCK